MLDRYLHNATDEPECSGAILIADGRGPCGKLSCFLTNLVLSSAEQKAELVVGEERGSAMLSATFWRLIDGDVAA